MSIDRACLGGTWLPIGSFLSPPVCTVCGLTPERHSSGRVLDLGNVEDIEEAVRRLQDSSRPVEAVQLRQDIAQLRTDRERDLFTEGLVMGARFMAGDEDL